MMNLTPWKKREKNLDTISSFRNEVDRLFDRFFDDSFLPMNSLFSTSSFPKVDVTDLKNQIVVNAELPGVDLNDLNVNLDGRILTIKGEKKQEKEEKDTHYYRVERSYGSFHRSIELPAEVDENKIDATFQKGVLKVTLNKTNVKETKKIQVKGE